MENPEAIRLSFASALLGNVDRTLCVNSLFGSTSCIRFAQLLCAILFLSQTFLLCCRFLRGQALLFFFALTSNSFIVDLFTLLCALLHVREQCLALGIRPTDE